MLGYYIYRDSSKPTPSVSDDYYYPPQQTARQTMEDLRAQEILQRDYEYITPNYGMYEGRKVRLGEITTAMKQDPAFLSPNELGKWVRKEQNNVQ